MKNLGVAFVFVVGICSAATASQFPPQPVCLGQFRVVSCVKYGECTLAAVTDPLLVDIGMAGAGCGFKQKDQLQPVFVKASEGELLEGTVQWGGDEWALGYTFVPRSK
ncbi:MAG: hypothetical protein HQL17_00690 [Candidatus Omnitrophica bacterium]|nr:hypothetical protein [Candidatus Omnitrophota bacterium]